MARGRKPIKNARHGKAVVNFTEAELNTIRKHAYENDIFVSSWVRNVVLKELERVGVQITEENVLVTRSVSRKMEYARKHLKIKLK